MKKYIKWLPLILMALCQRQRGSIYEAFLVFVPTYMDELRGSNYDARIGAVCWMQGESDNTEFKASQYYENQKAFVVEYLRTDLVPDSEEGGIWFIDAGFTIHLEPEGDPDWGHYDALCELELGRMFGRYVIQTYENWKK